MAPTSATEEQGKQEHGKPQDPPGQGRCFHNAGHGNHHQIVASQVLQAFGKGGDQGNGCQHLHEFPACVENSGKYGYDAAGNRFKADEAQDKQEGDADGRRILFEDHHCQDNNDAYEISVVERSQHYCGFYHNKSLLYLWNIIYDMGKCSPP